MELDLPSNIVSLFVPGFTDMEVWYAPLLLCFLSFYLYIFYILSLNFLFLFFFLFLFLFLFPCLLVFVSFLFTIESGSVGVCSKIH